MVKQNHIGATLHGKLDALDTRTHVESHLALGDRAARILQQAFNRLFDRLDIHIAIRRNRLGERRNRRRATARRRARHQNQAAVEFSELVAERR